MTIDRVPPGGREFFVGRLMLRKTWFYLGECGISPQERFDDLRRRFMIAHPNDFWNGWSDELEELYTSATQGPK